MNALGLRRLAEKLDVSVRTLERIIDEDLTFPRAFTLRPNGSRRWRSDQVEAWIEKRSEGRAA